MISGRAGTGARAGTGTGIVSRSSSLRESFPASPGGCRVISREGIPGEDGCGKGFPHQRLLRGLPHQLPLRGLPHQVLLACAALGLLIMCATASAAPSADRTPSPTTRPTLDRPQVDKLVHQLVDPQFKVRQAAGAALGGASAESLSALVAAYGEQPRYELKLQLREAIERVFYRRQLEGKIGFLGVGPRPENGVFDPKTGNTVDTMYIARVLPGFPAEKAGLLSGDMILDVDGKTVAEISATPMPRRMQPRQVGLGGQRVRMVSDTRLDAFTAEISRRDAGSTVRIRLLRAKPQDEAINVKVAGNPDRTLEGATLVPTVLPRFQAKFNPLSGPPLRAGLYVAKVRPGSAAAAAKLQAGEVVLGVSADFGVGAAPADQLSAQFKSAGAGTTVKLRICDLQQMTVPVTLGGRPVDRMNPLDMEIAQGRFADWWRAQTGETSYRTSYRSFPVMSRSNHNPLPGLLP